MRLRNERVFRSPKHAASQKRNIALSIGFLGSSLLVLLGIYFFSQRYQTVHQLSSNAHKRVIVSLSQSVKPVIPPSLPAVPLAPPPVPAPIQDNRSILIKVFARFGLMSSDYVLAQIGARALPETLYRSSESLYKLFTGLLDHIVSKNPLFLEAREGKTWSIFPKDGPLYKYATPFSNPRHLPQITIALIGFGKVTNSFRQATKKLPKEIALAYFPYSEELSEQLSEACGAGHETLLMIPMESMYYRQNNPETQMLLTGLPAEENVSRLHYHLEKAEPIIGITNFLGSRFTISKQDSVPVLNELKSLGLMMLDVNSGSRSLISHTAKNVDFPCALSNIQIDTTLNREVIEAKLGLLEEIALKEGHAIGYGFAYPLTIDLVTHWANSLNQRGMILAPLSSIVKRRVS